MIRGNTSCKAFQQIQVSTPIKHALIFKMRKNILPVPDVENTEQLLACFVQRRTDIDGNQTPSPHSGDMLLFIFLHSLRLNTKAYIKCQEEVAQVPGSKRRLLKDPLSGNRTLRH